MRYIANARMYSVNPEASAAWKELFDWLAHESGVALDAVDHAFPLALSDLWSRADLACAFMCGFPFMLATHRPRPVAAPIPAKAPISGRPVYVTCLVVRSDSDFHAIEDTFGGRLGYTVVDSHSGYNALRHHLLPYYRQLGTKLYRESIGPLMTPRGVIEALRAGHIDVGPLDGYALDLMRHHQPELGSQIRVVAITDPAPIPFLVASSACPDEVVSRLQATLATFAGAPACSALRERLRLDAFKPVALEPYSLMLRWDAEARAAGYPQPA
jgi:ABC-type phosphate/phosphonate transport system substrate-binding protein